MADPTSPTPQAQNQEESYDFLPHFKEYQEYKISPQSERVLQILDEGNYLEGTNSTLADIEMELKGFEFDNSSWQVSKSNKTTAISNIVAQSLIENAFVNENGSYKEAATMSPSELVELGEAKQRVQAINKMLYDDPVVNPLKSELGGHYDLEQAKQDLDNGVQAKGLNKTILLDNQKIIIEAVSNLPEGVQQLAMQGAKQATIDAKQNKSLGGMKTSTVFYTESIIADNLYHYDQLDHSAGKELVGGSYEQAFKEEMYNAKGRQVFAKNADNPDLASKKPMNYIESDLGESYTTMLRDGINRQLQKVEQDHKSPHTYKGDIKAGYEMDDILRNTVELGDALSQQLKIEDRDKMKDFDLVIGYSQTKNVVSQLKDLSEESLTKNLPLRNTIERTDQKFKDHDINVGRILMDHRELVNEQEIAQEKAATNDHVEPSSPSPSPR